MKKNKFRNKYQENKSESKATENSEDNSLSNTLGKVEPDGKLEQVNETLGSPLSEVTAAQTSRLTGDNEYSTPTTIADSTESVAIKNGDTEISDDQHLDDHTESDSETNPSPNFIISHSDDTVTTTETRDGNQDKRVSIADDDQELTSPLHSLLTGESAHYEISNQQPAEVEAEKMMPVRKTAQLVLGATTSYFRWIIHPLETIDEVASKNTVPQTILQLLLQILAVGLLFCSFTAAFAELLGMQATNLVHKNRILGSIISIPIHDFIYSINYWYVFIAGLVLGILTVLLFILLLRLFTFLFRIRITFAKLLSVYVSSLLPATLIIIIDCLLFKVLGSNAWGPLTLAILFSLLVFSFFFSLYLLNYSLKKYSDQEFKSMLTVVMTLTMLTFIPIFSILYGANYLQDTLVSSVQSGIRGGFDFIRSMFKWLPFI